MIPTREELLALVERLDVYTQPGGTVEVSIAETVKFARLCVDAHRVLRQIADASDKPMRRGAEGEGVMLTRDDLATFKLREGGKDKLTDQVIEAAERWLLAKRIVDEQAKDKG